MKQILAEGGITTDGMKKDPVSGNEVPPGSLAEEVRDDVPARLSTGEYVVPADVVRYFGVAYFEKLREKAKRGLGQMEADGRIGGEPMTEEDDFPFSDEELEFEEDTVGMAEGGIVTTQPDRSLFQRPGQTSFDRTQFSLGVGGQGLENRRYINPQTGEQRTVPFMNGQPLGAIPDGFVPYTEELAKKTTQQQVTNPTAGLTPAAGLTQTAQGPGRTQEERDEREGIDRSDDTGGGGFGARNYDKINEDPLGFAKSALDPTFIDRGIVGGVGMFAGPIAGLGVKEAIKLENIAQANAAKLAAEARGLDTAEIDKLISNAVDGLSGAAKTLYNSGKVATGENYYKSLLNEESKRGTTTPTTAPTPPTTAPVGLAAPTPATSPTPAKSPVATVTPAEQRSSLAPAVSTAPPPRPTPAPTPARESNRDDQVDVRGISHSLPERATQAPPSRPTGGGRTQEERDARGGDSVGGGRTGSPRGGRATGGLVDKPQKHKTKSRRKIKTVEK